MERKKFTPVPGQVYQNHGGGEYRCLRSGGFVPARSGIMQNTKTGWTFVAWGCTIFADGTIEWARSVCGTFCESDADVRAFIFDRYAEALPGIGPKLKEQILAQADADPDITPLDLRRLADIAYAESL